MDFPSAPPSQPLAERDAGSTEPGHAAYAASIPEELAIALYEQMVLARELDGCLIALQREGKIVQHASAIGEEAAIVGAAAAMRDEDWVFLASREFAAALWRGMPLAMHAHHLLGTGQAPGKGRNVHAPPFWKPARVVSVSPLTGTHISHAAGVAWAARVRKDDVAALAFFGEGATSSADFHTGLNFAGVTRSPLIAVCRNNGWATSMPASRQTASNGFATKAVAYGLAGVRVDGADVLAVLAAVGEARRRASVGLGGTLIEAVTVLHGEGETAETWEARDPIARMRRHLEGRGLSSPDREERLLAEVRADVARALSEAREAAPPARASLFDDVYSEVPWNLREQRDAAAVTAGAATGA